MNIIINRSDAIGDTLLTMPMAKFIKVHIPNVKIIFIIAPISVELFTNHPYVDDIWILDPKSSSGLKFNFLKNKFKRFKADAYFHVGGSHVPSFVAWMNRIKIRGGIKSKWQSFVFLNKAIRQHRSFVAMHESDYNISLLQPLGISYDFAKRYLYKPQIRITETELTTHLRSFIEDLNKENKQTDKPLFFVHPGMTGHTLNWSSRNYARLIFKMEQLQPNKYTFVISYTPSDEKFLVALRDYLKFNMTDQLENRVYFFDGSKRGLRHYMSILSQAQMFIGPSTGTTHIANTLGVKHVGLYSPIKVQSSLRWGPFSRHKKLTKVIVPDVVCGELNQCSGATCPYFQCMDKVEVDDVLEAVRQLSSTK
jgi:heptosyltransferase III